MAEAKARCPMREFNQWQRFAEIEPFGEEREDMRAAMICTAVVRAGGAKRVRMQDYMICQLLEKQHGQSVDEMASNFAAYAKQHNAKQKRARK